MDHLRVDPKWERQVVKQSEINAIRVNEVPSQADRLWVRLAELQRELERVSITLHKLRLEIQFQQPTSRPGGHPRKFQVDALKGRTPFRSLEMRRNTRCLWIRDNGRVFLIDTGATCSVIPPEDYVEGRSPLANRVLKAANGTSIHTYGTRSINVSLGFSRIFTWEFTIADVEVAMIGCDTLGSLWM